MTAQTDPKNKKTNWKLNILRSDETGKFSEELFIHKDFVELVKENSQLEVFLYDNKLFKE